MKKPTSSAAPVDRLVGRRRSWTSWKEGVSRELLEVVWRDCNWCCRWCGSRDRCGVDHIIPKSRGGQNTRQNFQLLCNKCGSWKGNDMPEQLLFRLSRLRTTSRWSAAVKRNGTRQMSEALA